MIVLGFVLLLAAPPAAEQPAEVLAELIVKNGLIVTTSGRTQGDVRVRNGIIVEIGANLTVPAVARVIDATGKLILPGGVDPHVHTTPVRVAATPVGADDFTSAGRAAFAGGITTIGTFVDQNPAVPATTTLNEAVELVRKQALTDMVLHFTVSDPTKLTPADVQMHYDRQFTLKIFMMRPGFDPNATAYVDLIRAAGSTGVLTLLHAEDAAILTTTRARMVAEGRGALKGQNFPDAGPVAAEEAATQRAVAISEVTGAPIYLVHISSERAMRIAEGARARGLPVFTEVRFIYLHLTRERFDQPDGPIYTGAPPLRDKSDQDYLWRSLVSGAADVVNTDHVGYTREEKMDPENSILRPRNAANYLQDQMPLLYSEGVRKGRITLERMVALTSTNPAKLFGLYPKKGTIAIGSDGDMVVWDPNLTKPIRDQDVLSNGKFSVFNEWVVTGWPVVTIRRGEVVWESGRITAQAGSGRLAPRERWQRP
jgi:dihydropyrimidinase